MWDFTAVEVDVGVGVFGVDAHGFFGSCVMDIRYDRFFLVAGCVFDIFGFFGSWEVGKLGSSYNGDGF